MRAVAGSVFPPRSSSHSTTSGAEARPGRIKSRGARLSTLPATADSSHRPHFSLLQCPRRRHVGADESSTPQSPSAAPAAAADLSAAAKQQQTESRHPKTAGPRQVECPNGHSCEAGIRPQASGPPNRQARAPRRSGLPAVGRPAPADGPTAPHQQRQGQVACRRPCQPACRLVDVGLRGLGRQAGLR
jgi:hypothetical protein